MKKNFELRAKRLCLLASIVLVAVIGLAACSSPAGGGDPATQKITMTTTDSGLMSINLLGTGSATIDWGDGASEEVTLFASDDWSILSSHAFDHPYSSAAAKTITVTGAVTGFGSYHNGRASDLNVSGCPGLKLLDCNTEAFTALDLSKNTKLEILDCGNNQLAALNLSKNTALEILDCYNNQLGTLDVTKNTNLKLLFCGSTQLTSLNITGCTELEQVYCDANDLPTLAMNAVLTALPDRTGLTNGYIELSNNPGWNGSGYGEAKSAAQSKNWIVDD